MKHEAIINNFNLKGNIGTINPHGGGHINDSYHLVNTSADAPDYLLQRVNHYVFKNVDLLMNNMAFVTEHVRTELAKSSTKDLDRRSLTIVNTKDDATYFIDPEGNYWRVLNFIDDHLVFETAPDTGIAYEGARMFGNFTSLLSSLPPTKLGETIPNFHNIKWRLSNLRKSIEEDTAGRVKLVKDEIQYVESSAELMCTIKNLGEEGSIPLRITHNDTKINNVLFDKSNKGLCVIDLDTVMPGYAHYDFGDGVRTFTNTGEEDDEDLNKISIDMEIYEAFAAGFLESTREVLTETEIDTLVYAGLLFPYMQGVRFLTDYLAGDLYYKVKHEEHNLVRTRAQLKLAMDAESKLEIMKAIVKKHGST